MKVLFLNPPFLPRFSRFSRSPAVTRSGTIYYPIWHAYAAGVLEQRGHTVKIVDAPAEGLTRGETLKAVNDFAPCMVVVYTSTPSIYNDCSVAGEIKDLMPWTFVVLTGPHVSALPKESLECDTRIDAVARGEYDITIAELAERLPERSGLDAVDGLTFRDSDAIISNRQRAFIEDLDSLPFVSAVYKNHLNIRDYFYAHCRYPIVSIFTSRGCNARCTYCVYPEKMFGRAHRQRTPESIVAEFEYIERELPEVKEVLIDDDTFSFNERHTIEFSELMIKRRIKVPWTIECRANLSYETMRAMKRAGCRLIVVGFESASDGILKAVKKGLTIERMRAFVADARKAGVMIHSCFMAGNPGETRETLEKSLEFAKEINADTCQFFPLMVYPGTEAYEWANRNGFLETADFRKWLTADGLHNCVVSTPELSSKDLVRFCDRARKKYYLGPRYLARKLFRVIRSHEEMKKTVKSARVFAKYLLREG